MPRPLTSSERELRLKAIRTCEGRIPEAVRLLAQHGHKVDYEALAAFGRRYRKVWQQSPQAAEGALRLILAEAEGLGTDPGYKALAEALGRIRGHAKAVLEP